MYGWTPLTEAAGEGHVEVVRLLLSAGADMEKFSTYGDTPLIYAARGGHVEVERLLLSAGADTKSSVSSDGYHHFDIGLG